MIGWVVQDRINCVITFNVTKTMRRKSNQNCFCFLTSVWTPPSFHRRYCTFTRLVYSPANLISLAETESQVEVKAFQFICSRGENVNSKSSGVDRDHLQQGHLDFVAILIGEVQERLQPTSFYLHIKFIELTDYKRRHKLFLGGAAQALFCSFLFVCFGRMRLQRRQCTAVRHMTSCVYLHHSIIGLTLIAVGNETRHFEQEKNKSTHHICDSLY